MTRRTREAAETAAPTAVNVGDTVDLNKPSGFVQLPDGTVVTCRRYYKIEHPGKHVIDGVEYDVPEPAKPVSTTAPQPAEPVTPEV